jgi:hypothetical protein
MVDQMTLLAETGADTTLADPAVIGELMVAIERMFKIGVYYPAGHAMCDQAAGAFQQALVKVIGKAPAMRFETSRDQLVVQGCELDPAQRGVRGFLDLLDAVGVSAVEIDSTTTATDLHRFVTRMLHYRNQVKGARDFQQVTIEGLPATITVKHQKFVARDRDDLDSVVTEGGGGPSLEKLLTTLLQHGLTTQEIARCRRLLESIPGFCQENQLDGASLPQVTWAEVEKLLLRAAKQADPAPANPSGGKAAPVSSLDSLAAIFSTLGEKASEANPREAIDLLVALSKRAPAPATENGEVAPPAGTRAAAGAPSRAVPDLAEFRAAFAVCAESAEDDSSLGTAGRAETLSILMQLISRGLKPRVQVRVQKQLRDILRTPLHAEERSVIVAGARDLLSLDPPDLGYGALRIVTEGLRSGEPGASLRFLADVCRGQSPQEVQAVWPFLVNELLLTGRRGDGVEFRSACELAARPTLAQMQAALPALEALEALRDRRCGQAIFAPPPPVLHQVFAVLLHSPQAPFIGEQLLQGLKQKPPNWLAEGVLPLLGRFQPQHRPFLVGVLQLGGHDAPAPDLAEAAAQFLAEALPVLPRADRQEPWVRAAIRAVARLPVPGGAGILRDIQRTRRYLFFHEWPVDCRQAARDAFTGAAGRPA